jgi:hypothetical protein
LSIASTLDSWTLGPSILTLQSWETSRTRQGRTARGQGALHPTPDPQAEAEACFHQALAVARCQQAKTLELRAAISLARLWQQQDKYDKARKLLAKVYG